MRLLDRDIEILDTLATKVRLLSVPQIADAWWPDRASGKNQAVRRLRQLKAAGLIQGTVEGAKSCYCINWNTMRHLQELIASFLPCGDGSKCC